MTGTTFTPGAQGPSVAGASMNPGEPSSVRSRVEASRDGTLNPAAHAARLAESSGHDERGRFAMGNPGGPGNPHHRKVAGLREALLRIVTPEDVEDIARKLIDVAKEGSLQAIKLFLAYVIGKPGAADYSDASAWAGDNDAMAWMSDRLAKLDVAATAGCGSRQTSGEASRNSGMDAPAAGSGSRQTSGEAGRQTSGDVNRNSGEFRYEQQAPTVEVAVVQPESAPSVNGGKRLTRQQRRALRRQAKGSGKAAKGGAAPKVNGDNGWLLAAAPAEDPLAALARQRDLLK